MSIENKPVVMGLQSMLGINPDGYWGEQSQKALVDSGKHLAFDWDKLRQSFGSFTPSQVKGLNCILEAINNFADTQAKNPLYVAYMLATAWHETARTMQPIEEYGKGRGKRYGRKQDIDGSFYKGLNHIYYGRGYVQLTWLTNYKKMKHKLGVDFVNNPSLALDPTHASNIMIVGMLDGAFTGKSLSSCIAFAIDDDFIRARCIINGSDKAKMIAKYADDFLHALTIV